MMVLLLRVIDSLKPFRLCSWNYRKRKNWNIAVFILSQRMMPLVVMIISYLLMRGAFGLLDTWWALIAAYSFFNLSLSHGLPWTSLTRYPRCLGLSIS